MSGAYFAFWLPVWAACFVIGWRSPTWGAAFGRGVALGLVAGVVYYLAGSP